VSVAVGVEERGGEGGEGERKKREARDEYTPILYCSTVDMRKYSNNNEYSL